ncbi:hypothetical protein [Pseudomonas sp. LFM046]|uniref:hypothetical protein n=1 Tax=Pseudomonas sp. LFM046 TaxID=1608357 RepID=UPI0005CFCC83|nr:hypothetical protein [Pseudomonas sp. LFM046]
MSEQNRDLLQQVLIAHGGLERWNRFSTVRASIVTSGSLWGMKGLTQDSTPRQMTVWLHEQRASVMPFGGPDRRTAYTPDRIAIETTDGQVLAERSNPRESFHDHGEMTPWDPLQRAYFNGYALWSYMTMPFLFTLPGVRTEEIAPWEEGNQAWRRLRVHFPEGVATHSPVQDFFFGEDFLLRRHDYRVDISGGMPAAQYVHEYIEADGLRIPGKRRAYRRDEQDRAIETQLLVAIDFSELRYA